MDEIGIKNLGECCGRGEATGPATTLDPPLLAKRDGAHGHIEQLVIVDVRAGDNDTEGAAVLLDKHMLLGVPWSATTG